MNITPWPPNARPLVFCPVALATSQLSIWSSLPNITTCRSPRPPLLHGTQAESQSKEPVRASPKNGSRLRDMCVFGKKRGQPQKNGLCCSKARERITEALPVLSVGESRGNGEMEESAWWVQGRPMLGQRDIQQQGGLAAGDQEPPVQAKWPSLVPATNTEYQERMEQKEMVFQGDESGSHEPKTSG